MLLWILHGRLILGKGRRPKPLDEDSEILFGDSEGL